MTEIRHDRPAWAGRVPRQKIADLYSKDAQRIRDEELIDDVGISLLVRIENIFRARDANCGLARCPLCQGEVPHGFNKESLLRCESCNWELTWAEYQKSFRGKHLISTGMTLFLQEYAQKYPVARSPQEKMILIDTLIHRYHWELEGGLSGPGARDLIGGKPHEIIDFLNHLSYSGKSSPEILETRQEWLKKVEKSREQTTSAAAERNRKKAEKMERERLKRKVREEGLARRREG